MKWNQAFKMAWKSILANKLRTFLTMLGIIIGVSAVITLVTVGQSSTQQVQDQVASLGSNLLSLTVTGRGAETSLTVEEALELADIPGVKASSPVISGSVQAKFGTNHVNVSVDAITPEYEEVRDFSVQEGRYILPIDIEYMQKVALIGTTTAQDLFDRDDPVGQYIQLNGTRYKVVGLLEQKGSTTAGSNDEKILIPITTGERLLRSPGVRSVYMTAEGPDQIDQAIAGIEEAMSKKFRGQDNSYRIFNQQDALETVNSITSVLTMTLAGIAGISLLVGGIGIMNIMLVSVTERTREIGIRKSVGARRRDILLQFLIESMAISLFGGIIGLVLSMGGVSILEKLMSMEMNMSIDIVIIAIAFSAGIGIVFGMFPANKAANLKPVDALRYD